MLDFYLRNKAAPIRLKKNNCTITVTMATPIATPGTKRDLEPSDVGGGAVEEVGGLGENSG